MAPNNKEPKKKIFILERFALVSLLYTFSCAKTDFTSGPAYMSEPAIYAGYDTTIYYTNYADSVSYTLRAELPANTLEVSSYRWTMTGSHPDETIVIGNEKVLKLSLKEGIYKFWIEAIFSNTAIRQDSVYVKVLGPFSHFKWKMISAVAPTALDIDGDGKASTDLFSQFDSCFTDNLWYMQPRSGALDPELVIDNLFTVCQNTRDIEAGGTMGINLPDWNYPFNTIRIGRVTSKINFPNDSTMSIEGAWIYPSYQYGDSIYARYGFRRK